MNETTLMKPEKLGGEPEDSIAKVTAKITKGECLELE